MRAADPSAATGAELLVPPVYDLVWSLVAVASLVLLLLALARWSRARASRGGGLVDLLVILLLPVLGPAAYLWGRRGDAGEGRAGTGGRASD